MYLKIYFAAPPYPCTDDLLIRFFLCTQETVIGLTERYHLYLNNAELASNCTSFCLHDEFLLITTHSHMLQCVCLSSTPGKRWRPLAFIYCIILFLIKILYAITLPCFSLRFANGTHPGGAT